MICFLNIHQKVPDSNVVLRFRALSKIVDLKVCDVLNELKYKKLLALHELCHTMLKAAKPSQKALANDLFSFQDSDLTPVFQLISVAFQYGLNIVVISRSILQF